MLQMGNEARSTLTPYSQFEKERQEVPNGNIEINVAGKLKSGRYVYGTDTVKIIGQDSK